MESAILVAEELRWHSGLPCSRRLLNEIYCCLWFIQLNAMLVDRESIGAVSYPGGPIASGGPPQTTQQQVAGTTTREKGAPEEDILYPRGPIAELPEEFESRRGRFADLDSLQTNWTVELRKRRAGSAVDAVFFSPDGMIFFCTIRCVSVNLNL